ncbi:unnamed protein product [Cuscuta epithymum]|uniref:DUF569 domain-containing protein n=1 Tax=Cuscuta epithymum TaxID=186058 RepID=A0AAV0FFK4_9ASTE|nr:unnamed protein product [Cuscuta epithymum]
MDIIRKAKVVRLRSHLNKYLVADDDQQSTRQSSRGGASEKGRWRVERVEGNDQLVRLKSCHGRYLTASDDPLLLGMTGNKVLLTADQNLIDLRIEWQPVEDGFQIKLKSYGGTYLRANGGTPPWRNSVTHDIPHATSTNNWIVWVVEAADQLPAENETLFTASFSTVSSFSSSFSDEHSGLDSPVSRQSSFSTLTPKTPTISVSAMEIFHRAKAVRLRSHHDKYLTADEDEESVTQDRLGSAISARWMVEVPENTDNVIRLKSCYGKYLTASNNPFLLGMTGRKVLQTLPSHLDSSLEWEPVKEGTQVKLRTRNGQFLRANGGLPPWKNSVTHDTPHRTTTKDWIIWDVHVVDILTCPVLKPPPPLVTHTDSFASGSNSPSTPSTPSTPSYASPSFSSRETPTITVSAMELFHRAKAVRLRSHHDKYLTADEDEESVTQDRHGSSPSAHWTVEVPENPDNVIRLKSCYGKYLTASNNPFLLGMTGRKVLQTLPIHLDSSLEWEPVYEGTRVKLRTRNGQFLRANGGLPPWKNSVTHDIPQRTTTKDWIIWDVHVVDILTCPVLKPPPPLVTHTDSFASGSNSPSTPPSYASPSFSGRELWRSLRKSRWSH